MGQKATGAGDWTTSALPQRTDINDRHVDGRFVPILLQKSVEGFREQ
jgi:hypothetical protein